MVKKISKYFIIILCILILLIVLFFSCLFLKNKILDKKVDWFQKNVQKDVINYLSKKYNDSFEIKIIEEGWYEDIGDSYIFDPSPFTIDDSLVEFYYTFEAYDSKGTKFEINYSRNYDNQNDSYDYHINDNYIAASLSKNIGSFFDSFSLNYYSRFFSYDCDNQLPYYYDETGDSICKNRLVFSLYSTDANIIKSLSLKINDYLYGPNGITNNSFYRDEAISINYLLIIFNDKSYFDMFGNSLHEHGVSFNKYVSREYVISKDYFDFELLNYVNSNYDLTLCEFSSFSKNNMHSSIIGYKKI